MLERKERCGLMVETFSLLTVKYAVIQAVNLIVRSDIAL
jgi:hypothetical protein